MSAKNTLHTLLDKTTWREEVDKTGWKTRPLGEVFAVRTGYTPSKDEPAYWENGTIPFVKMEDVRQYGRKLDKSHYYVTEAAVKGGRVFPANSFIISTSATIGEHAFVKVPFITNRRFTGLSLKPEFEGRLDRDFIFFYLYVLGNWCRQNVNVGTFAQVRMGLFRQFPFPIPPLPEQQKIANFLNNAFNNVALLADNATTRLNTVKHLKTALLAKVFHETPLTAPPHSTPDKESIPKDHTPKESTA